MAAIGECVPYILARCEDHVNRLGAERDDESERPIGEVFVGTQ
jgi:hypothetical protein